MKHYWKFFIIYWVLVTGLYYLIRYYIAPEYRPFFGAGNIFGVVIICIHSIVLLTHQNKLHDKLLNDTIDRLLGPPQWTLNKPFKIPCLDRDDFGRSFISYVSIDEALERNKKYNDTLTNR